MKGFITNGEKNCVSENGRMPGNCGGDIRLWIQQGNGISEGELQRVIRQLEGEMEYTYAPLAQVCASVSRRCSQNYRIWLEHLAKELEMPSRSLAIIWERCCESDLECLLLGREERVRLHELGMQLGSLDKKQETQIFLQYAEFLEEKRGGLLKEIQEKRRLCNLLGVTAGLFLTILIL